MDWNMFISTALQGVITAAVPVGGWLIYRYTGVQISAAQQAMIANTATKAAQQIAASAAAGFENTAVPLTAPVVQDAAMKMAAMPEMKALGVTEASAADSVHAAIGGLQMAAPTVAVTPAPVVASNPPTYRG